MKTPEDLTGLRSGRLTVISAAGKDKHGKIMWHCKCDCGNECDVVAYSLKHQKTKSCGCLADESRRSRYKDITGNKYGRLTAIEPTELRRDNAVVWLCKCDCGNEKLATLDHLVSGRTSSCGCLQKDKPNGNPKVMHAVLESSRYDGTNTFLAKPDKKISANNKSGVRGVFWSRGKWQAKIKFKGRNYYLGQYDNIEDAAKARREAEIRLFGNYQIEVSELNGEIKKSDVIAVLNWMMEHGFSSYTVAEVLGGLVSEEKRNEHE